jgi:hypothetical protein
MIANAQILQRTFAAAIWKISHVKADAFLSVNETRHSGCLFNEVCAQQVRGAMAADCFYTHICKAGLLECA